MKSLLLLHLHHQGLLLQPGQSLGDSEAEAAIGQVFSGEAFAFLPLQPSLLGGMAEDNGELVEEGPLSVEHQG